MTMTMDKERKKLFLKMIARVFISSMTGFGMFWEYLLLDWNVFISIWVGMFVSALMMVILNAETMVKDES